MQAQQVMKNVGEVLKAAGTEFENKLNRQIKFPFHKLSPLLNSLSFLSIVINKLLKFGVFRASATIGCVKISVM